MIKEVVFTHIKEKLETEYESQLTSVQAALYSPMNEIDLSKVDSRLFELAILKMKIEVLNAVKTVQNDQLQLFG